MPAILLITYIFNIIDLNLSEVKRLNIKVRKMMATHYMHHPKTDIHRLYLPRSNRGRGLTQLELSFKPSTIDLFRYLNLSDDRMLSLALKHEKEKVSQSVVKEVREFAPEIDLDLEAEFDWEMKNTKILGSWKELPRKWEKRLSILPGSQNRYIANTHFEAKKLR